jgi:hypothetical protein
MPDFNSTYDLFPDGCFELPADLSVAVSSRQYDLGPTTPWLGVLESIERLSTPGVESIVAQWAFSYGRHDHLVKKLTDNDSAELRTHTHELAVGSGLLQLTGVCAIDIQDYEPSIVIGGTYLSPNSEGAMVRSGLDADAKKVIGDFSLASCIEIMNLKELEAGSFSLKHTFDTPDGDRTEFNILRFSGHTPRAPLTRLR